MHLLKRVLGHFTVVCLLAVASIALNNSSRRRPAGDISELQDTFGRLTLLHGSHADLSGAVRATQGGEILFSTPLYLSLYAFEYKPTGLEFSPIENRRWRIAKYRADDGQQTDKDGLIDAKRTAEITFQGGGVYGSPTCGGWTGRYKLAGRRTAVDADVILNGFCPPEEWSESLAVVKAFKGELSIQKAGDEILLRGKDGRARVRLVPFGLPPAGPTK